MLVSSASFAAHAITLTADCAVGDPATELGNAIGGAQPHDVIEVVGACTEGVEIRIDDLTVQGTGEDVIVGQLAVIGAHRFMLQDLNVLGDGTPGLHGVAVTGNADVTIRNVMFQGVAEHGISLAGGSTALLGNVVVLGGTYGVVALGGSHVEAVNGLLVEQAAFNGVDLTQASSAVLGGVVVRQSGGFGVSAQGGSLVEVLNSSMVENNAAGGVNVDLASSAIVADSYIRNNGEVGIAVARGGSAAIDRSVIDGSLEGVTIGLGGDATLADNRIESTDSEDGSALGLLRGAAARLNGGNTLTSSGVALFATYGSSLIQHQRGHDRIDGPVQVAIDSSAEFRNVEITGRMEISDHALVRLRDQSGDSSNTTVRGNITVSQDSGLNFIGGTPVKVVGDISCADQESSLGKGSLSLMGKIKPGCTGY
jgi:hypothetical protein